MFSFPIFLRHDDIKTTREQANKIKGVCIVAGLVWFRKGERPTSNLNLTDMTDMTKCKRLSRVYGEGKTAPGSSLGQVHYFGNRTNSLHHAIIS